MRKTALVAITLALLALPVWAEATDLAGSYTAKGWDAGVEQTPDKAYTGTVKLTRKGGVLLYEGEMDGKTYVGVGIYDPQAKTLALHFTEKETGKVGVAHFVHKADTLNGQWAWLKHEEGKVGREIWTRK